MGNDNPNPLGDVVSAVAPIAIFSDASGLTNTGAAQSGMGQSVLKGLGVGTKGPSLNEQLQAATAGEDPEKPSRSAANIDSLRLQRDSLARRRASRTLFTGGQGSLDQPSAASSVLLGL